MQEEFSMHKKLSKSSWNEWKTGSGNGGFKSNGKESMSFPDFESAFRPRNRNYQRRGSEARRRGPHGGRAAYRGNRGREGRGQVRPEVVDAKRGRNLNHLLNFTITRSHGTERNTRGYRRRVQDRPKYDKDTYLQANCQFVVRENEGYSAHLHDPDLLVDWNLIERVLLHSNEQPLCPICIEAPMAGRITRCGHIYCWSCALHYMSFSRAVWSKCAICEQFICRTDLKSVSVLSHEEPSVGQEITFSLMRRNRNAIIAVPVAAYKRGITQSLPNMDRNHPLAPFSKLLVASDLEVLENIIAPEKAELLAQLEQEKGSPLAPFIQEALKEFEERVENMNLVATGVTLKEPYRTKELEDQMERLSIGNNNEIKTWKGKDYPEPRTSTPKAEGAPSLDIKTWKGKDCPEPRTSTPKAEGAPSFDAPSLKYESAFDDVFAATSEQERIANSASGQEERTPAFEPEKTTSKNEKRNPPKQPFHIYQALDGQLVFLHALNIDMLVSAYGRLDRCPHTLTGKIVELQEFVMTENLRGKLRCLGHLSIGSTFKIAEIDMSSGLYIKEQILQNFRESLNRRRLQREHRARCEEKREKRLANEAKKNWSFYSHKTINESDSRHSCGSVEGPCAPIDWGPPAEAATVTVEPTDAPAMSFAQMLRDGKARPIRSPRVKRTEVQGASAEGRTHPGTTDDDEDDDWVTPPDYHQSFSNAVAMNMRDYEKGGNTEGGKKKKKVVKSQLLFSTTMARGKRN